MTATHHHTDDQAGDVHDHIAQLTRAHTLATTYTVERGRTTYTQNHKVRAPSLLRQLEHASPSGKGEERSGAGFESRPAAALEAMGVLEHIDTGAARWLRVLGVSDRGETVDVLRRLGTTLRGIEHTACHRPHLRRDTTGSPCCRYHEISADVRSWWTQARCAAGWDEPAWRPDNSCPVCGARGSLRVRVPDKAGFCVECREAWSEINIGLLAEHIRIESWDRARRQVEATVCWCSWPRPTVDRWPPMCTRCGSPWCHRAGAERPTPARQAG